MLGLSCGTQDLSLQRAGFSLVVACGFSLSSCSVGSKARGLGSLRHVGSSCGASSILVVCGLSCPVACGILVP